MENSNAGEIKLTNEMDEIKKLLDANNVEGAKQYIINLLNINSTNMQAAFVLAQIYESEENFQEAAELYAKVFPVEIPAEFKDRILHVYELADKYDLVYEIQKKDFENNKNDIAINENFANTCCILQKQEEAISVYNNILSLDSNNIIALRQLTDLYNDNNLMMYHLTKAKIAELDEQYDNAEKEFKKAFTLAEKNEDILQIRYKLATLYKKTNKYEQALDEYNFILSENEENFSIFLETAEIYNELGIPTSAVNVLKRALHIYEDNTTALQMLVEIHIDLEEYDKAEKHCKKLVELTPRNIEHKVTLAKIYLHLNNTDETKKILLEAEQIDVNNIEVITALAGFYTYTSDFEKAKNYCNRIIQKLPQSPLGYRKIAQLYEAMGDNHLAHFNYGIYHEHKNEVEDAINEFNIALNYKKDDYEIIRKLANLHSSINEMDIALDYYHTLFEANVDIILTTQKIAKIYIELKDYQMAQKYLEETLETNKDIELDFLLGKCLYYLKDFETALEILENYKIQTKSLANIDETNKIINDIYDKKENNYNPLAKLFKLFG